MKAHLTDAAMFKEWLMEKKDISESSVDAYVKAAERFLKGNPDIDSLEDYNAFIIEHSIKKRIYHYYSSMKAFIEYKVNDASVRNKLIEGLIKAKVYNDIKMERRYLTEDEIFDVINRLKSQKHKVIALIQSLTGVRAGDVMRLKRGDGSEGIMPEEYKGKPVLRLNILAKRKKRTVVYIHDEIAQQIIFDYISTVYNHDDYYFIELGRMKNRHGKLDNPYAMYRMNYVWYWQDLKEALQSCGYSFQDFASHDLRRCFARRAWTKWKDLVVLQKLLHHNNPATTIRYLQQSGMETISYAFEMQTGEKDEAEEKK